MTAELTADEVSAAIRWREWQARGAASDLRTARRMTTVMALIAVALVVWCAVLLG